MQFNLPTGWPALCLFLDGAFCHIEVLWDTEEDNVYRRKQYIIYNCRKKRVCYNLLSPIKPLWNTLVEDNSFSVVISCPVTRWHQEHIILVSKRSSDSASFVRHLKELIKLSVLCHSTGGCAILLVASWILVLLKVLYFSIPVCLCGKEQNTNTLLDKALKKGSWGAVPITAAMITVESLTVTVQIRAGIGLISNQNTHRNKKSARDWKRHQQSIS